MLYILLIIIIIIIMPVVTINFILKSVTLPLLKESHLRV